MRRAIAALKELNLREGIGVMLAGFGCRGGVHGRAERDSDPLSGGLRKNGVVT